MEIIKSILFGIVHSLAEFLPLSSSGHVSLITHFGGASTELSCLYSAMLHMGSLVSVLCVFCKPIYELFEEFFNIIKDISAKKFSFKVKEMSELRRYFFLLTISFLPLIILFIPVGNGQVLWDLVSVFSHDNSIKAEGVCFALSGFLLLVTSFYCKNEKRFMKIVPFSALFIGVAQLIAICFPGFSRIGLIVCVALLCNVSKRNAIQYAFLLSVPAIFVSGLLEFIKGVTEFTYIPVASLIIGFVTSALVGVMTIRLFKAIVEKDLFKYFGFYCIGLGFVATVIGAIEVFIK